MDAGRVADVFERHEQATVRKARLATVVAQGGAGERRLADAAGAEHGDGIAVFVEDPEHELVEVGLTAEEQLGRRGRFCRSGAGQAGGVLGAGEGQARGGRGAERGPQQAREEAADLRRDSRGHRSRQARRRRSRWLRGGGEVGPVAEQSEMAAGAASRPGTGSSPRTSPAAGWRSASRRAA